MGKGVSQCSFVGTSRVRDRARARHVDADLTKDLETSPPGEWRREIDQTLFPGRYFKEFIFFHKASKTLILADGQIFFGMRLPLLLQRRRTEAAIRKIHSWQHILLSHRRCFDEGPTR
jgi:hypothetical protein